ncbi:MAG: hypothetical protein HOI70_10455 [Opitutae bacterium]|jgi:hypothetical protein|nr:hypothetical protein [Opitutae bacterium]
MEFKFLILIVFCIQNAHCLEGFGGEKSNHLYHSVEFTSLEKSVSDLTHYQFERKEKIWNFLYLQNFKQNFQNKTFAYRPFIHGIDDSVLANNSTFTDFIEVSSWAHKDLSFCRGDQFLTKYWKFALCEKISNLNESYEISTNEQFFPDSASSYRFDDYIFSWTKYESLVDSEEKDSLIPYFLLEAIKKNNFEIFFQQKEMPDDELHAVYLEALHKSFESQISKASSVNFSELASYIMIGGIICLFVTRYSNMHESELFDNKRINICNNLQHHKNNITYKRSPKGRKTNPRTLKA